jgi:hypothetical protein
VDFAAKKTYWPKRSPHVKRKAASVENKKGKNKLNRECRDRHGFNRAFGDDGEAGL